MYRIALLVLLSSCYSLYPMIGQPFNYIPARTPYWYRSMEQEKEQARIKKERKKRRRQQVEQEMQQYKGSKNVMPKIPDYPD